MTGPLGPTSGYQAIMDEVARQCALQGDPDASRFYAWGDRGLWRTPDKSEPRVVDIGSNRDDMQEAVELDVASWVRLRARRAAIGGDGEPDWSFAIHPATRAILSYVGVDPMVPRDEMDVPCGWRGGLRVDNVTHVRGCILAWAHLGTTQRGDVSFEAYENSVDIRLEAFVLPETVLAGIRGRQLSEIMPHPALDAFPMRISHGDLLHVPNGGAAGTVLRLETAWEPLVPTHGTSRDWITPVRLPWYV